MEANRMCSSHQSSVSSRQHSRLAVAVERDLLAAGFVWWREVTMLTDVWKKRKEKKTAYCWGRVVCCSGTAQFCLNGWWTVLRNVRTKKQTKKKQIVCLICECTSRYQWFCGDPTVVYKWRIRGSVKLKTEEECFLLVLCRHVGRKRRMVKTTIIKTIFIKEKVSSKSTFIKNQFHQRPLSSEITFITNPTEGWQDKTCLGAKNKKVRISLKASPAEGRKAVV